MGTHDKSVHNVNSSLKLLRQVSCHTAYEQNNRSEIVVQEIAASESACLVRMASL